MKNKKLIIALLVAALFIPTYVAIGNFIYMIGTPVSIADAAKVEIRDSVSGMIYKENKNSAIVDLLVEMNKSATPISSLPSGLSGQNNFSVTAISGSRETSSQYYIVKEHSLGYCVDSKGNAYELREDSVKKFLNTVYAQGLYEDAALPTLQNGANVIAPLDYSWSYKPSADSATVSATLTATESEQIAYTSKSGLSLVFSRVPDSFDVTVTAKGESNPIYTGAYENMSINAKDYSTLSVDATAQWLENGDMPYGAARYTFMLDIEAQPEFVLTLSGGADSDFVLGDVAMITAETVKEPESISLKITPALTHNGKEITPVFYTDGKHSYAFVPTAYDTAPGEYTLEISYAGINQKLTMNLGKKSFSQSGTHTASAEKIATAYNEGVLKLYDAEVEKILASAEPSVKRFTNEPFVSASTGYAGVGGLFGYGRTKTLKDGSGLYRNLGLNYTMSPGHKVQSITDGKVIYVGSTAFSGDMIAIDHGYGMVSFYHNLDKDSIKVSVGDIVKRGDVICSMTGDSGFTDGKTLHQRLTIYGVPVCEYDFWEA
ncbi:MAG: M23 family metallopeptidase, partial [Clostridia bacterium]|nr:M23 family metallopeptidase [Clostridia bacterium]